MAQIGATLLFKGLVLVNPCGLSGLRVYEVLALSDPLS